MSVDTGVTPDRNPAEASLLLAAVELTHALIRRIDGSILYWSQGAEQLYGWSTEEARARLADDLLETQYPLPKQLILNKLLAEGHWTGELRCRTKFGAYLWVASRWVLGRDETGEPSTITEVCHDITELKNTKERLEQSEARFRQFSEALPGLVWIVDVQGGPEFFNSYFFQYTGLTETCGVWHLIVHPDDQAARLERWRESLQNGTNYQAEYRLRRHDGVFRWHLARAVPMRDTEGRILKWFGASIDIDEQKRAAEQLQLQTQELARSNSDLENFASIASHDLQEPLRAICSFADLLEERASDRLDQDSKEFLGLIQDSGERMQHLISGLLAYAKVGGEPVDTPLVEVRAALDEAMANLQAGLIESGAEIVVGELPSVKADLRQIAQLFQNLLSNALKYRGAEPLRIEVYCERQQSHWRFQVKDNGIGFSQDHAARIFHLFRRLHGGEYPGAGIGLALCRRIVARHGGAIWAEGEPGRGAVFFFTLPAG